MNPLERLDYIMEQNYQRNAKHRVRLFLFAISGIALFVAFIFIYLNTGMNYMQRNLNEMDADQKVITEKNIEMNTEIQLLKIRVVQLELIMNTEKK